MVPHAASSTKQTAVSHSTAEAEVVAAEKSMRESGVPALDLWETVVMRSIRLTFLEDNQTMAHNSALASSLNYATSNGCMA